MQSSERKRYLSGWLEYNYPEEYTSSLKLQKFLFLYEAFSKVEKDSYEFAQLEGWKNGTVFCSVWNDYTKNKTEFNIVAREDYFKHKKDIDYNRAKICSFIVSILSEKDLSELTHQFHIWNCQINMIKAKIPHIKLYDRDFNSDDVRIVQLLRSMYPIEFIDSVNVVRIDDYAFLVPKEQYSRLTDTHLDTLVKLTENESLTNPVYIEIDDEGRLLVD